jgi:DNA mismatch repair protein MutS
MDEIGRGTSTYDGLSLAWACAVDLATRVQAYTLFATHYFELTQLPELYPGINNVHLDATEHEDRIVFLHALREGAADRSYGLHVAALAGVPQSVIRQARARLQELEHQTTGHRRTDATQMPLFQRVQEHPALAVLQELEVDSLSPRDALQALYDLKELATQELHS